MDFENALTKSVKYLSRCFFGGNNKGHRKAIFFVRRVSTNPGQTNEISILNGLNSTNADSATLFNADFVGP